MPFIDSVIVCADANLDNAAGGAVAGGFIDTGQYCCGTERVYVVDSAADDFVFSGIPIIRVNRGGNNRG